MRKTERRLLLFSLILSLGGLLLVCLAQGLEFEVLLAGLGLVAGVVLIHGLLVSKYPHADEFILPIVVLLTGLGLVIIFRLEPEQGRTQLLWVGLGMMVLGGIVWAGPEVAQLQRYPYVFGVLAGLLILLPLVPGLSSGEVRGARLWISVGPLRFQPGELAKLCMAAFLASYLARRRQLLLAAPRRFLGLHVPEMRYLGPLLLMWVLALGLLVLETDLGTALLFFGLFVAMSYAASGRVSLVLLGVLLFCGGTWFCYTQFGHVQTRFQAWLNPWADIDDTGYQITQSLFAIEAGGLFGRGFGFGRSKTIPELITDLPFAALVEELGLLGGGAVIMLYSFLVFRAAVIAAKVTDPFVAIFAAGLGSIIALQAFVIIGGTIKLIPLTGITLPFISYGGSSILTNYMLVALLLRSSPPTGLASPGSE